MIYKEKKITLFLNQNENINNAETNLFKKIFFNVVELYLVKFNQIYLFINSRGHKILF